MNTDFLQAWSTKLNVPQNELERRFEEAMQEMKTLFPKQSDDSIMEKAKLRLKVNYKRQFLSQAVPFTGIIIGNDNARDPFINIRRGQMEIYEKTKEKSVQSGNPKLLKDLMESRSVVLEHKGEIRPVWPKLKTNGEPNKLAGQVIMSEKESLVQNVYGICTPHGKQMPKGFTLELRGEACNQDFKKGVIVSFKALDRTDKTNTKTYTLTTNKTEFLPSEDKYFEEGIQKLGVTGMIKTFFSDNTTTWQSIAKWLEDKRRMPKSQPVPEKYNNLIVIPESMVVSMNLQPNRKGKIVLTLCSSEDDLNDATVLCLAEEELEKSIDFAQGSKIIAVGRPWIPDLDDEGNTTFILNLSGAFAYKDWKINRVDAQQITEQTIQTAPPQQKPQKATTQQSSEEPW